MIDTKELKGIMAKEGVSGTKLALRIGMTPKTFYGKMKKGVFGSDEIEKMVDILNISDPMRVFFAQK